MIECDRLTVERLGAVVLDRLSHTIHAGQTVAVIGRTAAGKTSLLETLATAIPPQAGTLRIDGNDAATSPTAVRRVVGYVPAGLPAWPTIRVDECLELFAASAGLRGHRLAASVAQSLETVGLTALAASRIDTLPAGQSKRLLLARALLHDPAVLLLDNPNADLDPPGQRLVEDLVNEAHLVGRVVVAAYNDAVVPAGFSDLLVISEGRLLRAGRCRPDAYPEVSSWQVRIECPDAAHQAAQAIGHIATTTEVLDAHALRCVLATRRGPVHEAISILVRAGLPVAGCRYDPPWPAQLLAALEQPV